MPNTSFLKWVLFILLLSPINTKAQMSRNWSSWQEIHKDQDVTVELRVYTPKPNSCVDKNKKFKFKYRVTGKYKKTRTYLNWKISYFDCNGLRYYQQNSLDLWKKEFQDISGGITIPAPDKQFTGEQIEKSFYEVQVLSSKQESSGLLPPLKSDSPNRIKGVDKIFMGETIDLEVEGGVLGEEAKWIWYLGKCGGRKIGEGKKVKLNIPRKTTVFVRAEGKYNKTKCVKKTIEVDLRSTDPNTVTGSSNICKGDNTTLSVNGGTLGLNAQWVWYQNECGVNKIGTGSTIKIQPEKSGRYYVRAESKLNITDCASLLIRVNLPVDRPDKIQVTGSTSICQGESVTLQVRDKNDNAIYKWYSESCGGNLVASGTSITVKPYQTTTYFVRTEGVCNKTICLSKKITVSRSSSLPSSIVETSIGKKKALQVSTNARLASDAQWKWYKEGCGKGGSIGNGTTIKIKEKRKTATYFVRAEGNCPSAYCTSLKIEPIQNISSIFQEFNTIHYGLAIGLEYNYMEDINTYSTNNINTLQGAGIRGEAYFYPLMKNFFSLGVLSSFSVGTSPYIFDEGNVPNTSPAQTDKYFYNHVNIGTEAALGVSFLKILTRVNKQIQRNNLDRTTGNSMITFDEELNREYLGVGLRVELREINHNVDVLYLLYKNNENDLSEFNNTFSNLGSRLAGFHIKWKRHNKYTVQTNIYFPITHQQFWVPNSDKGKVSFYTSILINLDRFY